MNAVSPAGALAARPRVALLVDGDNLRADLSGAILQQGLRHGDPVIRRVYGNAGLLKGWDGVPGFRLIHAGGAKNATDILLTVQAMALMLQGRADVLALASSDRDFTPLATHLREIGIPVIGMGEAKAPATWRQSCSQFHELAVPQTVDPQPAVPQPAPCTPSVPKPAPPPVTAAPAPAGQMAAQTGRARDAVLGLLRSNGPGVWVPVTAIGQHLSQTGSPGLKSTGHGTWRKFFAEELQHCEYDAAHPGHRVRLR